jgi:hypothetical protein
MTDTDEPITVPYDEPTDEDKARWAHEAEQGQLIDAVCGQLKLEVGYVQHSAAGTAATADTSSHAEFATLAAQCHGLSGQGYAAASQLEAAGIGDSVYSVRACKEVGFWANSASGKAQSAAGADNDTDIRAHLDGCVNDLGNAAHSINGT